MERNEMLNAAKAIMNRKKNNQYTKISDTACVMETVDGNIYSGVSLVARCGLGYCSEQACLTQMINNGETKILRFLTMNYKGELIPPCGRCIELMLQVDVYNKNTTFYIEDGVEKKLKDVFQVDWKASSY